MYATCLTYVFRRLPLFNNTLFNFELVEKALAHQITFGGSINLTKVTRDGV